MLNVRLVPNGPMKVNRIASAQVMHMTKNTTPGVTSVRYAN